MKLPRYRMKRMHEKHFALAYVSACMDKDVAVLEERIKRAIDCLDTFIGDTDPDEIDYYEHPEIHAMHILLGVDEDETESTK